MILDDEVEEVRCPGLDAGIERRAAEGLLHGGEAGLDSANRGARILEGQPAHRRHGPGWSGGWALLVVLPEEPPGAGAVFDDLQDGKAFLGDQSAILEGPGQEADGLLQILDASLGQPPLIDAAAAKKVVPERPGGPDAELRATLRVTP